MAKRKTTYIESTLISRIAEISNNRWAKQFGWSIEEIIQEAFLPGRHLKIYTHSTLYNLILFIIIISTDGKTAFGRKHWHPFLVKSQLAALGIGVYFPPD